MNKRIYIPTTILLIALLLSGCGFQIVTGSGKVVTETRDVSNFSHITLAGIGDVYVTQGEDVSVRIEAEDNLIPYFETAVQGDTLTIGIKNEYMGVSLHPLKPVKFYVTTPKIEAVKLAGSGNIIAGDVRTTGFDISLLGSGNISTGKLTATNVDVKLAGSGNIRLEALTADKVSSTISGSGDISMGGEVTEQHSEILGSGDYLASGLKSENAIVRVTGSGNSQVLASGTLNVTILGSGDVVYSGSPRVNVSISGSGKVNQASQP